MNPVQAASSLRVSIWEYTLLGSPWRCEESTASFFQLDVGKISSQVLKDIESACEGAGLEECKLPHGKKCLLKVVSDVLTTSSTVDPDMAVNKLISVPGDMVFSNLPTGSVHQPSHACQCSQNVWRKQVTGLAVNVHSLYNSLITLGWTSLW